MFSASGIARLGFGGIALRAEVDDDGAQVITAGTLSFRRSSSQVPKSSIDQARRKRRASASTGMVEVKTLTRRCPQNSNKLFIVDHRNDFASETYAF
jgi:hypothetical protein